MILACGIDGLLVCGHELMAVLIAVPIVGRICWVCRSKWRARKAQSHDHNCTH